LHIIESIASNQILQVINTTIYYSWVVPNMHATSRWQTAAI